MTQVTQAVNAVNRDAAESGGTSVTDGSSLNCNNASQYIGFTFGPLAIPAGATIDSAFIHVYPISGSYDTPDLTISGAALDSGMFFWGTDNEISGAPKTTATVAWVASNIGYNDFKSSPDIKSIIQEIVDRAGWGSGNTLTLFFAGNSSGSAFRLNAWDGTPANAAWIEVNFTASTTFDATASESISIAESAARRAVFAANVTESVSSGDDYATTSTLQAIANNAVELLSALSAAGLLRAATADGLQLSESAAPSVVIVATAADTLSVAGSAAARSALRAVAAETVVLSELLSTPVSGEITVYADDDTQEDASTGAISAAYTSANVEGDNYYAVHFSGLELPAGAQILTATLSLYVLTYDDPGLSISADATATPAALTTTNYDISGRSLISPAVNWSAANIGINSWREAPDLSAVIGELVDLPGWTGDNDVVLVMADNGTGGHIRFQTYDAGATYKPFLTVSYYTGTPLPISVTVSEGLTLSTLAARRAIYDAIAGDSTSVASAVAVLASLLVVEEQQLAETIRALLGLKIADNALIQADALIAYGLTLSEPVELSEALAALGTLRSEAAESLSVATAHEIRAYYGASEDMSITAALSVTALLSAIVAEYGGLSEFTFAEFLGGLEAYAYESVRLSGSAAGRLHAYAQAAGMLSLTEHAASVYRTIATVLESVDLGDAAGALATLRLLVDESIELSEADAAEFITAIISALASEGMTVTQRAALRWSITTIDSVELAATLATVTQFVTFVSDVLNVTDLSVFLLPSGIVRIQFGINRVMISFDISAPRADLVAAIPRIEMEVGSDE